MLDFLYSVYSKVIQLFTTIWNAITWYHNSGNSTLQFYKYFRENYVNDYVDRLRSSLEWYKNVAKSNSDYLVVYNFSKTVFSAVDSFSDIGDYRFNLKRYLQEFIGTTYSKVKELVGVGYFALRSIVNMPDSERSYLLNQVNNEVRNYASVGKPAVNLINRVKNKVEGLTEEITYNNVKGLSKDKSKIDTVVQANRGGEVTERTAHHGEIMKAASKKSLGLIDQLNNIIGEVAHVVADVKTGKYDGLMKSDKDIHALVKINQEGLLTRLFNNPAEFILSYIRDVFLAWFGDLLYTWLMGRDE